MNIIIEYEPTAVELAKASSLFVEKKPFLLYTVGFINIVAGLILVILILKLLSMGLLPNEWLAAIGAILWLFARKPFNEWLLLKRMKQSLVVGKPLKVELSRNGVVWSGKGLIPGHMPWEQIKYILEAQNGFLLPNNLTQFLWLPIRGFSAENLSQFKELLIEKNVVLRSYPKWKC
jgi:hypothetical protein